MSFPIEGEIFDYYLDYKLKRFKNWKDKVSAFKYDPQIKFQEIFVPNPDSVKFEFISNLLINNGYNVLIVGNSGVGKTIITK